MTFKSINPATEEVVGQHEQLSDQQLDDAIDRAYQAFRDWRSVDFDQRAGLMRAAGEALRKRKAEFAELMTREMGKPITQADGEIEKCAWVCDYYADNAQTLLTPFDLESNATRSFVTYQPLGPVFAVMPWNFPFWQVFRFAAPNLMGGNVGLLKHAPNVIGCAEAIAQTFREAGFPDGVFTNLTIDTDQAARALANPRVRAATLTGSTRAGSAVAGQAGKHIKKTVLELGGSDAYLILEDADVDQAIAACSQSRLLNSGQSCIGAKRFIVVGGSLQSRFTDGMAEALGSARVGDPMQRDTEVGPLARPDLRDGLHQQVEKSQANGARCLIGGAPLEGPGSFYMPSVLVDVKPGMPAYDEELFGPVASIIGVDSEQEAVRVANDTPYGLGSGIFSRDIDRALHLASHEIEAGATFINSFVASDPRLPFGGVKQSGYGRELAAQGIHEFMNIKTVSVK